MKWSSGLFVLLFLFLVGPASARQIDFGITDTGEASHFKRESERLEFRFPMIQTFHPWGNSLNQAIPRWRELGVQPVLHISTADDETREELITPWGISRGKGDSYLLALNRELNAYGQPAIVRPLGEPNRLWNPYCAYRPDGSLRDWRHRTRHYKRAFRRIYLILHGGSRKGLNEKLRRMSMPGIRGKQVPRRLPNPELKVLWSPLPGNASLPGNGPRSYWPGGSFVDMVGTSFYSFWPHWRDLNRFYRIYAKPGRPFSLAEWGVLSDDPGFARDLMNWCSQRRLCQSMFYYRGFDGRHELRAFPRTLRAVRSGLRNLIFRKLPSWEDQEPTS